ncbi:MAG: hypothetical protein WDN23_20040 [Edaphobacter sp.]
MASPLAASKMLPMTDWASSGAKTTEAFCVGTRRALRRRRVRRAAS